MHISGRIDPRDLKLGIQAPFVLVNRRFKFHPNRPSRLEELAQVVVPYRAADAIADACKLSFTVSSITRLPVELQP